MLTKHSDMESDKQSPGCSAGDAVRWMRCRRSCSNEGEMSDAQMRMDRDVRGDLRSTSNEMCVTGLGN
ncbi:hypothetical protein L2E82_12478 [Cichorium intybus]|uniref:Uncharacterized protein n=1 Tax=Cichorium intybus TaxID=13427 RepID=A0ACB9GH92_CICIN|nr:hypothetical protein L2E82_12478 [Cichorium intybus]